MHETDTIYIWTGEIGDTFDLQDVRGEAYCTDLGTGAERTRSSRIGDGAIGASASVTAQLRGAGGIAFRGQSDDQVHRQGMAPPSSRRRCNSRQRERHFPTPVRRIPAETTPDVVDTVTAFWDKDNDNVDDGTAEFDDTGSVVWDDNVPLATSATLSQTEVSTLLGTFTTISVTVRDKFGQESTAPTPTSTLVAQRRVTPTPLGSRVHTRWQAGTDRHHRCLGRSQRGRRHDRCRRPRRRVADLIHYWVEAAGTLSGSTAFDVIAVNAGANTLDVVQIGAPNYYRLSYDNNDQFNVNGGATEDLAGFETALTGLGLPALDGRSDRIGDQPLFGPRRPPACFCWKRARSYSRGRQNDLLSGTQAIRFGRRRFVSNSEPRTSRGAPPAPPVTFLRRYRRRRGLVCPGDGPSPRRANAGPRFRFQGPPPPWWRTCPSPRGARSNSLPRPGRLTIEASSAMPPESEIITADSASRARNSL